MCQNFVNLIKKIKFQKTDLVQKFLNNVNFGIKFTKLLRYKRNLLFLFNFSKCTKLCEIRHDFINEFKTNNTKLC